jgi:hypothetical protein
MEKVKVCNLCKSEKPISEFFRHRVTRDGYTARCKICIRPWQETSKIRAYGLTIEQFSELMEAQDFRCAICHIPFDEKTSANIDHDHLCCPTSVQSDRVLQRCGKCVRGLLCTSCNVGLGMFKDDLNRVLSAVRYLETYQPGEFFGDLSFEDQLELNYSMLE